MIPQKARKPLAWGTVAVGLVGGFEGLRTVAYRDPIGVPTLCFGETLGVRMGDRKTPEECKSMLEERLEGFYGGVVACVPRLSTQSPERIASHVSLAYNIGVGAYCKSTVARRSNAGDWAGGCDAFLMWNKAKGIPLPGLQRRREEERRLCLQSAANSP